MRPIYDSARAWVKSHAEGFALENFRTRMEENLKRPVATEKEGYQKDSASTEPRSVSEVDTNDVRVRLRSCGISAPG